MNPVHEHCSSQNFPKKKIFIKLNKIKIKSIKFDKIFKNKIFENKILLKTIF